MPTCITCGQPAHWQAFKNGLPMPQLTYCSKCKPNPWTSGSPLRKGFYYRPLSHE